MSAGPARTCSGSTVEKKRVTARLDVNHFERAIYSS